MSVLIFLYQFLIAFPILLFMTAFTAIFTVITMPWKNSEFVHKEQQLWSRLYYWLFFMNAEVEGVLDELKYPVAGRLPRCNTLLRNIASGDKWDKYLRKNQRAYFMKLYSNIWEAYRQMRMGNFSNLWNN